MLINVSYNQTYEYHSTFIAWKLSQFWKSIPDFPLGSDTKINLSSQQQLHKQAAYIVFKRLLMVINVHAYTDSHLIKYFIGI